MTTTNTFRLPRYRECKNGLSSHLHCLNPLALQVNILDCTLSLLPMLFISQHYLAHCLSGWRVGWAIAPPFIASAIRNIHVKITDCAPAPFQEAALTALRSPPEYFGSLRRVGCRNRNFDCIYGFPHLTLTNFLLKLGL